MTRQVDDDDGRVVPVWPARNSLEQCWAAVVQSGGKGSFLHLLGLFRLSHFLFWVCFVPDVFKRSRLAAFPKGCHAPGAGPEAVMCDHVSLNQ